VIYIVVLIGVRNNVSFAVLDHVSIGKECGFQCAKPLPLKSMEEAQEFVKKFSMFENEGVVVRDSKFNHVIIRNLAYYELLQLKKMTSESVTSLHVLGILIHEFKTTKKWGKFMTDLFFEQYSLFSEPLKQCLHSISKVSEFIDTVLKDLKQFKTEPEALAFVNVKFKKKVVKSAVISMFKQKHSSFEEFVEKTQTVQVVNLIKGFL
jgi:hypothetical protein